MEMHRLTPHAGHRGIPLVAVRASALADEVGRVRQTERIVKLGVVRVDVGLVIVLASLVDGLLAERLSRLIKGAEAVAAEVRLCTCQPSLHYTVSPLLLTSLSFGSAQTQFVS